MNPSRKPMTGYRHLCIFFMAITLPWLIVCTVNALTPVEWGGGTARQTTQCNRACSGYPSGGVWATSEALVQRGSAKKLKTGRCAHAARAVLPARLTADQGLYGQTIRTLYAGASGDGGKTIYGALNLGLFVVFWPGFMALLLAVGLRQRHVLRRRRGRR
jgi:hypothetical protein